MVKKFIEQDDDIDVEDLEAPEEMEVENKNTKFKEMYVYDPKSKSIKTVVQKKQTRKHFNEDKMKEHMEKMRLARQSKIKAKKQQESQPQPQPQPQPQQQPDLLNIRDLIRSELLNHLPKPKQQPLSEPEKKIEVEKAKPKRSRRPPQKQEEHVSVENKTIEVPKSFIPNDYISPSFSIFGY
jgi:hypothetical protein